MVTILIVTHNSLPYLNMAINSIEKNTVGIPYKILVVDNGSDKDTQFFLKKKNIWTIRNEKNIGYIEAQAQAFKHINSPYLCLCNDDIVVTKNWIKKLVQRIKNDPLVKIVAPYKWSSSLKHPYYLDKKNSREAWEEIKSCHKKNIYNLPLLINEFTRGKDLENFKKDFKKINKLSDSYVESPPDFVPGFCLLTEVKIWRQLGGLINQKMKTYGTEDVERCWRLGNAGYKIIKTGDVYVHHFEGGCVNKNKIKTKQMLLRNNRILINEMGNILWDWLRKELQKETLEKIFEKHWLIKELLDNCKGDKIPVDIKKTLLSYEKNN